MDAADHNPINPDGTVDAAPASGRPAHATRPIPRLGRIAAAAGIAAAVAGIGLGTAALINAPRPTPGAAHTLRPITVASPPAVVLPLSGPEILTLLDHSPDFGPLADPQRRASCLTGLGYPSSTRVLGARPIDIGGRAAVLLVLPGEQTDTVTALAVPSTCSAADTGLLADTVVRRP